MFITTHNYPPGSDMDRADRMLATVALFLTDARCDAGAREWFLREFEKVRSEAKAQLREHRTDRHPLGHLFGPKDTRTTATAAAKSSKTELPPITPAQRTQLDALFGRRPAPTPPATATKAKPPKVKTGGGPDLSED